MKEKQYVYFVSYSWSSDFENGFGNTEIFIKKKIDRYDLVQEIREYIEKNYFQKKGVDATVVILHFVLLREEEI